MQLYEVHGEILSPVHIGTGQTWEPFEYYVDSQKNQLFHFSTESLLGRLQDEEKIQFYKLIESNDLNLIRSFIVNLAKSTRVSIDQKGIDVTPAVAKVFDEKITDIQNQLLIQPMIRGKGDGLILIPGSSIKGAIRTAVVSTLAQTSGLPKPNTSGKETWRFESLVLKYTDAKSDPFRSLKYADATLDENSSIFCPIYNAVKDDEGMLRLNSIQLIFEVTRSFLSSPGSNNPVTFNMELRLDDQLMKSRGAVSRGISVQEIISTCNSFYNDKLNMEHQIFYKDTQIHDSSQKLLSQTFKENECLLRVGRFSGVESVTFDGYRDPQPPGRTKRWGTSRNIADGKYPMGWVKLRFDKKKGN